MAPAVEEQEQLDPAGMLGGEPTYLWGKRPHPHLTAVASACATCVRQRVLPKILNLKDICLYLQDQHEYC